MKRFQPCLKCGGEMILGIAIQNTLVGVPDFVGDPQVCTVHPGGTGKLVECLKCELCGWSVTV